MPDSLPERHWFEDVADHLGPAYLRYSFTMGTKQEVSFLVQALNLQAGMRVLDVGCGPGRHALELAKQGISVVGVDISDSFIDVARESAATAGVSELAQFIRSDARQMSADDRCAGQGFDAAISLCQGAFGLGGEPAPTDPQNLAPDLAVLSGIRDSLRPGGKLAVSAFSSYFQLQWLEESDRFNAATAVNTEQTELRNAQGTRIPSQLWTTCYTPRELRMLAERAQLQVEQIYSVTPGEYGRNKPTADTPEFLLLAQRPI